MSLFDSASLVVTPNGVKEGKLYSIKPTDGSGDLSVTRATTATRVNSAGLVEVVPYNLVTYSEQFDNAAWILGNNVGAATITANNATAPNGTLTADKIVFPSVGSPSQWSLVFQPFTSIASTYNGSFYIKGELGTEIVWISFTKDGVNYQRQICNLTTEWQRFNISATLTAGADNFQIGVDTRDSSQTARPSQTIYLWGGQLVEGSSAKDYFPTTTRLNIPRLDYTSGSCPSILVEPQRTNLYLRSEEFDNASWTKIAANVTANATTSPSGNLTAEKLIATAASSTHLIVQQPAGAVSGTTATVSVFAKASELSRIQFLNNGGGLGVANFNLSAGTATLVSGVSASIQNVGNGWYRCIMSYIPTITGNYNIQIRLADSSGNTTFLGNGTDGLFIWGAQIEAGANATSYIPTTSASVTRNADVISKTGISSLIGQTEGTVLIDINYKVINGTSMFFSVRPSVSNKIEIFRDSQTIYGEIVGNSVSISLSKSSSPSGTYKIALAYKSGETVLYVNGTNVGTSTTAFSFSTSMADLFLGSRSGGTLIEQGFFNQATIWKERLTNDQLSQLTTI
jgi:hypothetical protein